MRDEGGRVRGIGCGGREKGEEAEMRCGGARVRMKDERLWKRVRNERGKMRDMEEG